jgi:hypothetical protein
MSTYTIHKEPGIFGVGTTFYFGEDSTASRQPDEE